MASLYSKGKTTGLHNHGTTHDMGKKVPSTFSKVSASAGKNSGTSRTGDKSGCSPQGKGK